MSSSERPAWGAPWRPMETAPDGEPVLVITANGQRVAQKATAIEDGSVGWVYARRLGPDPLAFVCDPLGWMPLPPADDAPPNAAVFRESGFESWPRLLRQWIEDERLTYDQHTRFLADDLRRLLSWIEAAMRAPRVTEAMVDRLLAVQPVTMSMWPGRVEDLRRENARRMLEAALGQAAEDPATATDALDVPLPVTIAFPGVVFRRGVSLRTLVLAATRWKKVADEALSAQFEPAAIDRLRALLVSVPGPEPVACSACGGSGDTSAAPAPEPCPRCGGDGIEPGSAAA